MNRSEANLTWHRRPRPRRKAPPRRDEPAPGGLASADTLCRLGAQTTEFGTPRYTSARPNTHPAYVVLVMCLAAMHRVKRPNSSELTRRCGLQQTCRFRCRCLRCSHRCKEPLKLRTEATFSSGARIALLFRCDQARLVKRDSSEFFSKGRRALPPQTSRLRIGTRYSLLNPGRNPR